MRELMLELIEKKIAEDFVEDKPMQKYCEYYKMKHIQMATQIVLNCIELGDYVSIQDIDNLIHGLNHIFFNGIAAGQRLERKKGEK